MVLEEFGRQHPDILKLVDLKDRRPIPRPRMNRHQKYDVDELDQVELSRLQLEHKLELAPCFTGVLVP